MRYAVSLPNFGAHADCRALAELAHEAETAGWDGFFIWDHILFAPGGLAMSDPWVALAAVALRTARIRIGTLVTPLPRRRPWKLARETVSLDRLSGGRLTLGVGLGDPAAEEFGAFGEETNARHRAGLLDEGLDVLAGLWSGAPFRYAGAHYRLDEMTFLPAPAQTPRIPIWVACTWPHRAPLRRAARWDGVFPLREDARLTPDDVRAIRADVARQRTADAPFDVLVSGETPGERPAAWGAIVAPYIEAGATWWIEDLCMWRFDRDWDDPWPTEQIRERVRQGPPRAA
ncbi:MAG TPA: LLM class flavin-dependent oxidoreductase [Thermomicrobiales bacterium]|nr:LLM class flavin-dependent oxidoreductase [Thermomicrobiales bacterium]